MNDPYDCVAVIALVVAVLSLLMQVDLRARLRTALDFLERQLERPAAKDQTKAGYTEGSGKSPSSIDAVKQSVSAPLRAAEIPPQAIAPKLKKPPIPAGGFGSKANVAQVPNKSDEQTNKD